MLKALVDRSSAMFHPVRAASARTAAFNFAALSGAAVASQLLAVATAPILLRLYAPDAFGVYFAMTVLTTLGSTLVTLRFELGIQSPRSQRKAFALAMAALSAAVVMMPAVSLVYLIFAGQLSAFLKIGSIAEHFYFIPATLATTALGDTVRFLLWRRHNYNTTAVASLVAPIVTLTTQIALGLVAFGPDGLLIGAVAGQVAATLWLILSSHIFRGVRSSLRSAIVIGAAREFRALPLFTMPAGFVQQASNQVAPLMVVALFGPHTGGLYYMALRLIAAPAGILSAAAWPTFVGSVVSTFETDRNKFVRLYLLYVGCLLALMLPLVLLFPFGGDLFALAFGGDWRLSGDYAAWVAIGAAFHLAANATSCLPALKMNRLHACWATAHVILVLCAATAALLFAPTPLQTVAIFSIASALSYALLITITTIAVSYRRHNLNAYTSQIASPSPQWGQ